MSQKFAEKEKLDELYETTVKQEHFVSMKYSVDLHSNEIVLVKNDMEKIKK